MRKASVVLFLLLVLWFSLDLLGLPGFVTRDDWLGPSGLLELILLILLFGQLRRWKVAPFLILAALSVWGYLQYLSHWYGFFFGASSDRLTRYYAIFSGMYRLFPESSARIVPDAYHFVLAFLIAVNWTVAVSQVAAFLRLRTRPDKGPVT